MKPTSDGRLLLCSDSPETPPTLIKSAALERAFGPGTDLLLQQPDHWRMIDEGWFVGDDLYEPTDFEDPAFLIWTEAHDFLYDLFRDRIPFRSFSNSVASARCMLVGTKLTSSNSKGSPERKSCLKIN